MFIQQKDANGIWNIITDGYVHGTYKTEKKPNGEIYTTFSLCYGYNKKTKEYLSKKVTARGEVNADFIASAKRDRHHILVLGISNIDIEDNKNRKGDFNTYISASSIIPLEALYSVWSYYKSSLRYDNKMMEELQRSEDRIASSIRYDYRDQGTEDPTF